MLFFAVVDIAADLCYNPGNERQKNMESIINPRIILKFDKNKPAYYPQIVVKSSCVLSEIVI